MRPRIHSRKLLICFGDRLRQVAEAEVVGDEGDAPAAISIARPFSTAAAKPPTLPAMMSAMPFTTVSTSVKILAAFWNTHLSTR